MGDWLLRCQGAARDCTGVAACAAREQLGAALESHPEAATTRLQDGGSEPEVSLAGPSGSQAAALPAAGENDGPAGRAAYDATPPLDQALELDSFIASTGATRRCLAGGAAIKACPSACSAGGDAVSPRQHALRTSQPCICLLGALRACQAGAHRACTVFCKSAIKCRCHAPPVMCWWPLAGALRSVPGSQLIPWLCRSMRQRSTKPKQPAWRDALGDEGDDQDPSDGHDSGAALGCLVQSGAGSSPGSGLCMRAHAGASAHGQGEPHALGMLCVGSRAAPPAIASVGTSVCVQTRQTRRRPGAASASGAGQAGWAPARPWLRKP